MKSFDELYISLADNPLPVPAFEYNSSLKAFYGIQLR